MQDDFSSNNSRAIQIGKDLAELKIKKLEDDYDAALMALNIAKKENARYREALEFYANQNSWIGYHRDCTSILNDDVKAKAKEDGFDIIIGGRRAREALKGE